MREGVPVNDDQGLEHEAEVMGATATQLVQARHTKPAATRVAAAEVMQMATQIKFTRGTINYRRAYAGNAQWAAQTVGVDSEAYLDPADPKTGSRTGAGAGIYAAGTYNAVNGGAHLTQGHLLNANLGGHALNENLFPITAEMNKAHSVQVEEQVKTQLLRIAAKRVNPATAAAWANRRLYYRVQVAHPNLAGGPGAGIAPQNIRQTTFQATAYITNNLNPGGQGGVAPDLAQGHTNMGVQAPFDLNTELANLGFVP